MRYSKVIPCLLALFFLAPDASAQDTLYWLGAVSTDWTDTDNWSETRGGTPALNVPTASTAVILTSGSTYDCKLNANALAGSIDIEAGAGFDVDAYTLGVTNGFTQHGGTFYGRSSAIGIGGALLVVDGDFNSTSGTLSVGGGIHEQNYGSFLAGTGKVKITSSSEIDLLSFLYDLEVPAGVTATLGWHTPLLSSLVLGGTINTNSKALYIDNPSPSAISGSGGIHVDVNEDISLIIWRTAEQAGSYRIPLLSSLAGTPIPFDFTITSAGTGEDGRILLTMLAMDGEKPQVPFESLYYTDGFGGDNTDYNSHRCWLMVVNDYDVSPTITATFSYTDNDIAGASITESQLQAQLKTETGAWQTPTGTVDAGNNQVMVTGITGNSDEANVWTLVDNSSPNATPDKLYWLGEESADWGDEFNWTYVEGVFTLTGRAPCATCTAIIPSGTDFDCVLDANVEVGSLEIRAGATFDVGTFDLDVAESLVQHGGVFFGRSSTVTVGQELLIVDGTFNSTTGTLSVSGTFQEQTPGSIDNQGGTVTAGGDLVLDIFSQLYRLVVPAGTKVTMGNFSSVSNSVEVDGTLDLNAMGIGISNPNSNALKGTGGIYFDGGDDIGIVYWEIGEGTGTYRIPVLSTSTGPVIPFDIEVLTAGGGEEGGVMVTTAGFYDPEGAKPMDLLEGYPFTNQYGTDNSRMTANRLWAMGLAMYDVMPEISLGLGYDYVTLANTDIVEANLKVQSTDFENPWSEPSGTVDIANKKVTLTGNTWEDEVAQFFALVDGTSPNRNVKALYWTGADDNDWSNGLNWSWEPGGVAANQIPGISSVARFLEGAANVTFVSSTPIQWAGLEIGPNFDGMLDFVEAEVYITTDLLQEGGLIQFDEPIVRIDGNVNLLAGTLIAPKSTLTIGGSFIEFTEVLNHNEGTMIMEGNNSTINAQSPLFGFELRNGVVVTLEKDLSIIDHLVFTNGLLNLDYSDLYLFNGNSNALSRIAGGITSETYDFTSLVHWEINENTGSYVVPFVSEESVFLPITFEIQQAGISNKGMVSFSTYATDPTFYPNNTPFPPGSNNNNSEETIDRYWLATCSNYLQYPTYDLKLRYSPTDIGGNNNVDLQNLQLNYFDGESWSEFATFFDSEHLELTAEEIDFFSYWCVSSEDLTSTAKGFSCDNPALLSSISSDYIHTSEGNEFWFKTLTASTELEFSICQLSDFSEVEIERVLLYSGDCGNLIQEEELMVTDPNNILFSKSGLQNSTWYLVKLVRAD